MSTSEVAGGGISRTLAIAESGKCTSALYDDDDATTSRPSVRTSTSDALRSKQRSNASRRYDPLLSAIITRWAVASEREYTCSACSGPWSIRGGRTRSPSADSPSMNSNVLAIPCVRPEARSKTPAAGLTIAPASPFPIPLRKPTPPSRCAPSIGAEMIPVSPSTTPRPNPTPPFISPSSTCCGASWSFRYLRYSESILSVARPSRAPPPGGPPSSPSRQTRRARATTCR